MTQKSYFWDVAGVGDYQSEYSDDEFALALLLLFNYDRRYATIAYEETDSFNLEVGDQVGSDFVVPAFTALVDGKVYVNDSNVTLTPASGDGYYAIILRKDETAQTIRLVLLYNAGSIPSLTQTAATWETMLASFQISGGAWQYPFAYYGIPLPQNLVFPAHGGEDEDDWGRSGNQSMFNENTVFVVGVMPVTPAGAAQTIEVTFPVPFKANSVPLVFTTPVNYSGGTPSHARVPRLTNISHLGFSITVDLDTNINAYNWVAVGPDDEQRV